MMLEDDDETLEDSRDVLGESGLDDSDIASGNKESTDEENPAYQDELIEVPTEDTEDGLSEGSAVDLEVQEILNEMDELSVLQEEELEMETTIEPEELVANHEWEHLVRGIGESERVLPKSQTQGVQGGGATTPVLDNKGEELWNRLSSTRWLKKSRTNTNDHMAMAL